MSGSTKSCGSFASRNARPLPVSHPWAATGVTTVALPNAKASTSLILSPLPIHRGQIIAAGPLQKLAISGTMPRRRMRASWRRPADVGGLTNAAGNFQGRQRTGLGNLRPGDPDKCFQAAYILVAMAADESERGSIRRLWIQRLAMRHRDHALARQHFLQYTAFLLLDRDHDVKRRQQCRLFRGDSTDSNGSPAAARLWSRR